MRAFFDLINVCCQLKDLMSPSGCKSITSILEKPIFEKKVFNAKFGQMALKARFQGIDFHVEERKKERKKVFTFFWGETCLQIVLPSLFVAQRVGNTNSNWPVEFSSRLKSARLQKDCTF